PPPGSPPPPPPPPPPPLGQQLVRLGQAMQNPNTKLGELTELVQACGVDLRICDTNKENRS
ncbi:hypothetical protein AW911_22520, partial [Pseudomonas aeruginosa]